MLGLTFSFPQPRRGRTYLLIVLAVACIAWGLYASIDNFRPTETNHVRLAGGSAVERRFQIAECLAGEARACGLDMEAVPTKSFADAIKQVSKHRLDAAVVSSGLQIAGCEHARLLAGLDVAPLHILVRRELAESGLSLFELLKGKRVNLGEVGTNDRQLARDLTGFLQLSPIDNSGKGDYTALSLSKDELSQLADSLQSLTGSARDARLRELPDVVMIVSSLPSPVAQRLLDTKEYTLMPFPYASPFLMSDLKTSGPPTDGVNRLYVEPTTIPAAMYVGDSPLPAGDCPTIGMRSLLVAREDLPVPVVEKLMQTVFETDFARRIKPLSPREIATTYQLHAGAIAYLDRDKPLLTGHFFESVSKAFSIFGAFSAGGLSIYGYLRKRRIRRPGEYFEEIRTVDALASGEFGDGDARQMPEVLARQLDTRLVKLKEQLIHDYCNNRVQGELVLMSILSMLADSRADLRRSTGRPIDAKAHSIDAGQPSRKAA
jgi:TRAP-type uncharacterized transport system substrate-binding protein